MCSNVNSLHRAISPHCRILPARDCKHIDSKGILCNGSLYKRHIQVLVYLQQTTPKPLLYIQEYKRHINYSDNSRNTNKIVFTVSPRTMIFTRHTLSVVYNLICCIFILMLVTHYNYPYRIAGCTIIISREYYMTITQNFVDSSSFFFAAFYTKKSTNRQYLYMRAQLQIYFPISLCLTCSFLYTIRVYRFQFKVLSRIIVIDAYTRYIFSRVYRTIEKRFDSMASSSSSEDLPCLKMCSLCSCI